MRQLVLCNQQCTDAGHIDTVAVADFHRERKMRCRCAASTFAPWLATMRALEMDWLRWGKCDCPAAGVCQVGGATQFSMRKSRTRSNSRVLFVTSVTPSASACAAIHKSLLPMGVPLRSRSARNAP